MDDVVKSKRNSVKTTWNFCCMGRKGKKAKLGGPLHCVYLGICGRKEMEEAFEDLELLERAIKFSFRSLFWNGLNVDDYSMTMIVFVDWVS